MESNQNPNQKGLTELFGEVVFSYSRAQAIADGVLVDVTKEAQEAGFRFPTAITAALWSDIEAIPASHSYQDIQGRLWDVLFMASFSARRAKPGCSRFIYQVILNGKTLDLVSDCGPGDDAEPVITIGYQQDF